MDVYKAKIHYDGSLDNVRYLSTISMHQMDLKLLFYLMLMIVYIGIHMKILENGLLTPWERYSM